MTGARTGIFISTCDRGDYTERSLASLLDHLPAAAPRIFLVDDASSDFGAGAREVLDRLRRAHPRTRVFRNSERLGVSRVVRRFVDLAGIFGVSHLYITDNDVLYAQGWFDETLACYEHFAARHPRAVVSCLNVPKHRIVRGSPESERFVEKISIGGASWLASLATMKELLTPDIDDDWDVQCLARLRALGGIVGCTRRSFVQHFGAVGLHSWGRHDRGVDFTGQRLD